MSVSVVIPALNEQDTVAGVVEACLQSCADEVLVVDPDSTDATAERAAAAGARVVPWREVDPREPWDGKGEALWKSLAATTGDLVVFLDADLLGDVSHFVPGLLGPLLADAGTAFVKGCYTRPLEVGGVSLPAAGGRVTELTARPLLNALWPSLAGVVLLGRDREQLARSLARHAPAVPRTVVPSGDDAGVTSGTSGTAEQVMTRVVQAAARLARPGDTVLLAPAAASMDVFTDYAHRGRAFAEAVRALR